MHLSHFLLRIPLNVVDMAKNPPNRKLFDWLAAGFQPRANIFDPLRGHLLRFLHRIHVRC